MTNDEYQHVQAQLKLLAAYVCEMVDTDVSHNDQSPAAALWHSLFKVPPEQLVEFTRKANRSSLS